MRKNENLTYDYSNYYYKENHKNKKVRHKKLGKFSAFFFALFLILVVGFFSYAFSNFLTVGKIVNVNNNVVTTGRTLYGISLYTETNKTDAESKASILKSMGGAGFVLSFDDSYKVLSSIYYKKSDAESVKNNLISGGENAEIIEIDLLPINLKINLTSKNYEVFSSGVNLFYENYLKLYSLSLSYDKNEIDVLKMKNSVEDLKSGNETEILNFNKVFNSSTHISVLYVKIYLKRINYYLNNFLELDDTANFSAEIKNTYCNIISTYLNMQKDMA